MKSFFTFIFDVWAGLTALTSFFKTISVFFMHACAVAAAFKALIKTLNDLLK